MLVSIVFSASEMCRQRSGSTAASCSNRNDQRSGDVSNIRRPIATAAKEKRGKQKIEGGKDSSIKD
jgi:hypothetical protein